MPTDRQTRFARWRSLAGTCLVAITAPSALADLSFDPLLGDHMVVQRDRPIVIQGTADPGAIVTVALQDVTSETRADAHGHWSAAFPPRTADASGVSVVVRSGADVARLDDVLVGDVWVCAGQSNMEWPIARDADRASAMAEAERPLIRLFQATYTATGAGGAWSTDIVRGLAPGAFCRGAWTRCDATTLPSMSAVGFWFGDRLVRDLDVPIGLVDVAAGGTPTEAWIPRTALASDPRIRPLVQPGNWLDNPELGQWCRERAAQNLRRATEAGEEIPGDDIGPNHAFKPGFMWTTALEPLTHYPVRGLLWYQGESNAETPARIEQHRVLFSLLIVSVRAAWSERELPILFVQLPAMGRPHWPAFREQQRQVASTMPHVGMAVTIDVGHPTDVHPRHKRAVGERLARLALARVYDVEIVDTGPTFARALRQGRLIRLDVVDPAAGIATSDRGPLVGFEVVARDGTVHPATATTADGAIVIDVDDGLDVVEVRYAWAPVPVANLVNREGLPASPQRIEIAE